MSLRRELKDRKIRVSTVRIHHVASEFLSGFPAENVAAAVATWKAEGLLGATPLLGPDHVAETIAFLIGLPPSASVHDVDVRAAGA